MNTVCEEYLSRSGADPLPGNESRGDQEGSRAD